MDVFNNRELALLIWLVILVIGLITYRQTRKSSWNLLRSVFQPKLTAIYAVILVYTIGVVFLLHKFHLWDRSQLKNTILWFLTVGLFSLPDLVKEGNQNYFRQTVKDVFSFTALLQFIIGVYTFGFLTEFIIVPIAALIGGMIAFARRPEDALAKKFLENLLLALGLFTIIYTVYRIAADFRSFASKGTLKDFLIPGALSFLFLPLVYVLSLYVTRERILIGVSNVINNPRLFWYAKWQTLIHFAFNNEDLDRWRRLIFIRPVETDKDIRASIKLIKQLKIAEKNPPDVPPEKGWSPYEAKAFLVTVGIETNHYQPVYEDEWSASSKYLKIDEEFIGNDIAYYIDGDQHAAKNLKLVLNVHLPQNAEEAHSRFLDICRLLYLSTLKVEIPPMLETAILSGQNKEIHEGNRVIRVGKNIWPGHRMNGYSLDFSMSILVQN